MSPIHSTAKIRFAGPADATALASFAAKTFHDTYAHYNDPADMEYYIGKYFTPEQIAGEIAEEKTFFVLVMAGEAIAGYAKLKWGKRPVDGGYQKDLEIARFYAGKEFIGQGIGSLLMERCLSFARKEEADAVWLDVWKRNERAIKFYEKWNFRIAGEWQFILGKDVQDDFIMDLRINN
jgi:ribosomal protein S18 acetylase RimI-like enzyme